MAAMRAAKLWAEVAMGGRALMLVGAGKVQVIAVEATAVAVRERAVSAVAVEQGD
jgi:hypothetical protein